MSSVWPVVPLGEVLVQRKEFIRIDDTQEYLRCRVQLHAKGVVLRDRIVGGFITTKDQQVCRAGEFLVAEIDAKVGGFGIVPLELEGSIVSSHYFLFTINAERLDGRFLDYYCRTPSFREQVQAQGSTNYAAIRPQQVLGYTMPLPPLSEQHRIVTKIERLAGLVEEARALAASATEGVRSIVPSRVSKIDELMRKRYPVVRLERFARPEKGSFRSGPFGSALLHDEFVSEGVPAIGIQDVQEHRFELTRKWNVTQKKAEELRRYRIWSGDLLVTVMGTLGRACVVPDDAPQMVSTKHVWTITLDTRKVEPRWLSYWINYSRVIRGELLAQGTGTAIPGLNGVKLRSLLIPEPPLAEQERTVAELDAVRTKSEDVSRSQSDRAAMLEAIVFSILDQAFKGEL